ncbi:MAG: DegT/DnrJ/EryC1/StrS aminotransferase family protein [Planctomycetota bacterium]|nr:DegT/DnrJ/EryC1/StrS aminotransferase family protein [Planctomycetota bacterium]MDA1162737.1 DegT/DnrJ/EryC1/StrS aminotransferase family protein [Planctomycetota bacterium]
MSRQPVSPLQFTPGYARSEHTTDVAHRARKSPAAAAAVVDLQRLIALGPSKADWQTELETEVSRLCGTPHVVAVASPNVALHCVLAAGNLQPEDEVIIPAYLPPSIPEVIRQLEAHPILVDVDAETAHIDLQQLTDAVTDRTRAIVTVDIAGLPVDARPLAHLCRLRGLLLINDAQTQTPGIGMRADLIDQQVRIYHCRSEETSLLSSGALICTADKSLAAGLRREIAPLDELTGEAQQWDARRSLHYADRMTELAAVWQLAALGKARDGWRRRCEIAMSYTAAFSCRREFQVPFERPNANHSWLDYPLRLNLQHLGVSRDDFTSELRRRGVGVRVPCLPVNLMPHYQERYGVTGETFPVARNEFLRRVCLPIDGRMSDVDIDRVINTLMKFADELLSRRAMTSSMR